MVQVKVLIAGYVKNNTQVVPTTTLIRDGKFNIVVDPGMGKNKKTVLKKALANENLTFADINLVFYTHYHLDHTQYVGLFPQAKLVDAFYIYEGENWLEHEGDGYHLSPNVSIIHTPGHTPEHASLKVETPQGTVVVAGDVWWFDNFEPKIDEMASDQKQLEKSRQKILKIADWIIPGHGKMIKNPHRPPSD